MKIHDETRVPEFMKMLDELKNTRLEIGIFGEDDGDMVMIATVNEFGCQIEVTDKMRNYLRVIGLPLKDNTTHINIPERSFIRGGYTHHKDDIINKAEPLLERVLNLDLPVNTFFNVLGEYIVGLIQDYLTSIKEPANHPFTLERKKPKTNPLINDGHLRDSIDYKVVKT